jgi:polysaccharide deacetylase family protein (PEP-CTERM system associated)
LTSLSAMTFDIEDWFQVFYGEKLVSKSNWPDKPSELPQMIEEILFFLEQHKIKATFFVVGWLAERHKSLLQEITMHGHEIASHGFWHTQIWKQSHKEFSIDLRDSKNALEEAIQKEVNGYRAPGYSVSRLNRRAIEQINEAGYKYDSSLLFNHDGISVLPNGIIEVAPNSMSFLGRDFPINGGFVFRAMPYALWKRVITHSIRKNETLVFYTHSWEMYPPENSIPLPVMKKTIQYYNLDSVRNKMDELTLDFNFVTVQNLIKQKGLVL